MKPEPPIPYKDQPLAGAGFSVFNGFMLCCSSVFVKLLSESFGPVETVFFRNLMGLPMLVIGYIILRQTLTLKTNRPWHHLVRSGIGTVSVAIGAWSLSLLTLAQATVLFFTSPLFVIVLSAIFLKEKIGIYRIGAVLVGFSGVFIIAAPSDDMSTLGLISGLLFAFGAAAVDICLRWLGNTENSSTTTFYFLFIGLLATSAYLPFSDTIGNFEIQWVMIALILGLGLSNVFALLAKSESFRLAEASFIAPMTYVMIIWAVIFDYFIWNKIPGWEVLVGGSIIVAANLFIIHREQIKQ